MMKYIAIIIISIIITFLTVLLPVNINGLEDLNRVKFGYPLNYITQNLSSTDMYLRENIQFQSIWEFPTSFDLLNFIVSVIIVFLILFVFFKFYELKSKS